MAGYQLTSFDPDSAADRGFKEGYTELLGVRRAYRGRGGIAQALLADAMQRYALAGMDVASLDVDSANPPTGGVGTLLGHGLCASEPQYDVGEDALVFSRPHHEGDEQRRGGSTGRTSAR